MMRTIGNILKIFLWLWLGVMAVAGVLVAYDRFVRGKRPADYISLDCGDYGSDL